MIKAFGDEDQFRKKKYLSERYVRSKLSPVQVRQFDLLIDFRQVRNTQTIINQPRPEMTEGKYDS